MTLKRTAAAMAAVFLAAALPALAQVVPSAEAGGLPLVVGAGASRFNTDCGPYVNGATCYVNGVTVWVDWNLVRLPGPSFLHGLGIELEGRDLDFGVPAFLSNTYLGDSGSNMREDTGLAGVIYTWRHYRKVHPYGKVLAGLGSIDFPPLPGSPAWYRHDNRTIAAFGGGVDLHAWRSVWVRADYEYQIWPNLFGLPHALTPNGATIGAVYDFRGLHRR